MDGIKSDYLTKMRLFDELLKILEQEESELRVKEIPYDEHDCALAYVNGVVVGRTGLWRAIKVVKRIQNEWMEDEAN